MNELTRGAFPSGERLTELKEFALSRGVRMGTDAEYTVCVYEQGHIAATGSLSGSVLKYIAVSPLSEGGGLCALVVSELVSEAYRRGRTHLFIFTSPDHARLFKSLGFYEIVKTQDALMLENRKDGLSGYLDSIEKHGGENGAIVMNADPFTMGHRYLCEQAAKNCDHLYVFVLSENAGMFKSTQRLDMVRAGTADVKNLSVHVSDKYLISRETFPAYFIKDEARTADVQADLDIALFGTRIANALSIKQRFVGTEPYCTVTNAYNARMKEMLPPLGVQLVEIKRAEYAGAAISASEVRKRIKDGGMTDIAELVPQTTYEYILAHT